MSPHSPFVSRLVVGIVSVFLAVSASAASNSAGAPTIAFSGNTVRVSGVTPGATVVVYAVTFVRIDYGDHVLRFQKALTDDDRDGAVVYDVGRDIPQDGVWVAVDATNGQYAIGTPRFGAGVANPQPLPLHKSAGGLVDLFSFGYPSVEALYIHPGHGVWAVHAYSRGKGDHTAQESVTTVSLADAVSLLPAGESKAKEFAPGGVIIAFDLPHFRVFTTRLTGADIGGAR